jgi:hypothetical protein
MIYEPGSKDGSRRGSGMQGKRARSWYMKKLLAFSARLLAVNCAKSSLMWGLDVPCAASEMKVRNHDE